jgi:hypothetical protein
LLSSCFSEGEKTNKDAKSAETEKSPVRNEGDGEEGEEPKKEKETEEEPKAAAETDVMSAKGVYTFVKIKWCLFSCVVKKWFFFNKRTISSTQVQ